MWSYFGVGFFCFLSFFLFLKRGFSLILRAVVCYARFSSWGVELQGHGDLDGDAYFLAMMRGRCWKW